MCQTCSTAYQGAALLLAEQLALADDTGYQGATRPLSPAERRSKVRFGDLDRLEQLGVTAARAAIESLHRAAVDAIMDAVGTGEWADARRLAAAAERLARTEPPTVARAAAAAATAIRELLAETYTTARAQAAAEARAQGITGPRAAAAEPPDVAPGAAVFATAAAGAAMTPWQRVTQVFNNRFVGAAMVVAGGIRAEDLRSALAQVPVDGAVDEARQALHQAIGAGRADAAQAVGPKSVWASELLDGNTCGPCSVMDGQEYDTVADARQDYPLGGYKACKGGARCRGTLVFEYGPGDPAPVEPPPSVLDDLVGPTGPPTPPFAPVATPSSDPRGLARPGTTPQGDPGKPPKRKKGQGQRFTDWGQVRVDPALRELSPLDLAAGTNPRHNVRSKVYGHNCTNCVTAYEARARGLDVEASRIAGGKGRVEDDWLGMFEDTNGNPRPLTRFGSRAELDRFVDSGPADARYIVQVQWRGGGGHVFVADRRAGTTHWVEPQIPDTPDASTHLDKVVWDDPDRPIRGRRTVGIVRVDDMRLAQRAVDEAVEKSPDGWLGELTKADAKPYSVAGKIMRGGSFEYLVPRTRRTPDGWEVVPEAERRDMESRLNRAKADAIRAGDDLSARRITTTEYRERTEEFRRLEQEVIRWAIR